MIYLSEMAIVEVNIFVIQQLHVFSWKLRYKPRWISKGGIYDHMWPSLRKSTMWVQKNHQFLVCLLYYNLITIYTTATKSLSLLQNFMCFLLQLMEMGSVFRTKDISENITPCNLCSHGRFSRPGHILVVNSEAIIWEWLNGIFDCSIRVYYIVWLAGILTRLLIWHIVWYINFKIAINNIQCRQ